MKETPPPRVPFSEVANGESLVVHRTLLPSPIPSTALLLFLPPLALPPRTYRRTTICECQLSCTLRRDSNSYVFILKRDREGGRSPACLPPSALPLFEDDDDDVHFSCHPRLYYVRVVRLS